jgi:large subunit ribosomal protein L17
MRHGVKLNHLGRTASHRKAMMSNMGSSLIKHKRITTTLAKAKALRLFIEPLITKSKNDTTHNRRTVFSYLKDKEAVTELFGAVSEKIADRPGGYTRIFKLGNRMGDNADMAMIELVDFNEFYQKESKTDAKKSTRRGRTRKDSTTAKPVTAAKVEDAEVEEVVAVEAVVEDVKVEETVVEETKAEVETETEIESTNEETSETKEEDSEEEEKKD